VIGVSARLDRCVNHYNTINGRSQCQRSALSRLQQLCILSKTEKLDNLFTLEVKLVITDGVLPVILKSSGKPCYWLPSAYPRIAE